MGTTNSYYHCNQCGRETNHYVLFEESYPWEWSEYDQRGSETYYVIQCMGCDKTHFLHQSWSTLETNENDEPIDNYRYYPPSLYRPIPKWFHRLDSAWDITQLLGEVYAALGSESYRLAVMGIRALLESLMVQCSGDHGSFAKNLGRFKSDGFISSIQMDAIEAALEIGHASIHRRYKPDLEQIGVCLDICENVLETIVINRENAKNINRNVPRRES